MFKASVGWLPRKTLYAKITHQRGCSSRQNPCPARASTLRWGGIITGTLQQRLRPLIKRKECIHSHTSPDESL